jgi:NAD(P)-dependent dehydrogenase (short-subunit alcohol dehydrogenase family)
MPHALVTGGTRGIGEGIVRALLSAGYTVTATGFTDEEIAAAPPREGLSTCRLDVTDAASVEACMESLDSLDALVNCAGMILRGGEEYEIANFQRVIEVNLTGTMRMCVAAKPLLARSRGTIVNTASMLSYFGGPMVPAYTASKGGVAQLTKALAAAWAAEGIRRVSVAPGGVGSADTRPRRRRTRCRPVPPSTLRQRAAGWRSPAEAWSRAASGRGGRRSPCCRSNAPRPCIRGGGLAGTRSARGRSG